MQAEGQQDALPDLPGWRFIRTIGGGTFGQVWLAKDQGGQYRAIKIVRRAHFKKERYFEREFRGHEKYGQLSRGQPGLIEMFQLRRVESHKLFYGVMELADPLDVSNGVDSEWESYQPRTLEAELIVGGAMPVEKCLNEAITLSRALGHLHDNGLVHRDIKPSNIVYVNDHPKLVDIGLVTHIDSTPSLVGTYGYIPFEGPGKTTADVYALGKVLYEMLTGRDRFEFPELSSPGKEMRPINAVILKACASLPKDRYQSAGEMASDLERIRDGREPVAAQIDFSVWSWACAGVVLAGLFWWILVGEGERGRGGEVPQTGWEDGVAAYWPLDGHARDVAGKKHHGVAHGVQMAKDRHGHLGGALHFDGKAYIDFGDRFDIGRGSFSVSLWLRSRDDRFGLIGKTSPGFAKSGYSIAYRYLHDLRRHMFSAGETGGSPLATLDPSQISVLDGVWHQIAMVIRRDGVTRLYLDGELMSEVRRPVSGMEDLDNEFRLLLGAAADVSAKRPGEDAEFFIGDLDDVRVWQRALAESEVQKLYQSEVVEIPVNEKWDFNHTVTHVYADNALKHIVRTNNVKRFVEWQDPPIVYWGTLTNDVIGEMVYQFDFKKPVKQARLFCAVHTWDFSNVPTGIKGVGRGAGGIQISTNGVDWEYLFNGLEPVPVWEADSVINRELDPRWMGGTNYFVRIRLLKEGAEEPEYATAQHARSSKRPESRVFSFQANFYD